jgi:hypothetical protein
MLRSFSAMPLKGSNQGKKPVPVEDVFAGTRSHVGNPSMRWSRSSETLISLLEGSTRSTTGLATEPDQSLGTEVARTAEK